MNQPNEILYNVACLSCDQVWTPVVHSRLWWRAKKHDDKGFLSALYVSGQECGCQKEIIQPDAPYRVSGFDDLCRDFDLPFVSLVKAAKTYLNLARDGTFVVFFTDKRTEGKEVRTRVQMRLEELKWA